jgi:hypothetical protein
MAAMKYETKFKKRPHFAPFKVSSDIGIDQLIFQPGATCTWRLSDTSNVWGKTLTVDEIGYVRLRLANDAEVHAVNIAAMDGAEDQVILGDATKLRADAISQSKSSPGTIIREITFTGAEIMDIQTKHLAHSHARLRVSEASNHVA